MSQRVLAIECATEACSVALFDDDDLVDSRYAVLGRGHAERLVPMIAELPGKGRASRILVSLGPGSFTGVRIGLAAARALALAWSAEAVGYPTLSLVAAKSAASGEFVVCMAGGHGEWFVQPFDAAGSPVAEVRSLAPAAAVAMFDHEVVIGSRAEEFVQLRGRGRSITALPDARDARALGAHLLKHDLAPIYGRPPDARIRGAA